ncbi:MAG: four-carbon acid sugar kinase family protein [Firmicutes bacterium]|nr:four-carbon acid sugar kinase family protein [Bacillota bacterium]
MQSSSPEARRGCNGSPIRLGLVADDLTGSNDTGVQFAKQGLGTLVILELAGAEAAIAGAAGYDVLVINTDSRADDPATARSKARQGAKILLDAGIEYIYKKIDSTLRGNLGAELEGVMDAAGAEAAFFIPALPALGRTTVGGFHLVRGVPVSQTEIARDLISPVTESHIPTLLAGQCQRPVGHIPLGTVLAGVEEVKKAISDGMKAGQAIFVIDATTEEHLLVAAQAIVDMDLARVTCGSAGLAEILPRVLGLGQERAPKGLPVLTVAGTRSQVTVEQVKTAVRRNGVALILAQDDAFGDEQSRKQEIARLVEEVRRGLGQGSDVILAMEGTMTGTSKTPIVDPAELSRLIAAGLGEVTAQIVLGGPPISGLILTGGDTALAVCRRLQAPGLSICDEVLPGIPYSRLLNGEAPGTKVVTKAGAFGDREALIVAMDYLKSLD